MNNTQNTAAGFLFYTMTLLFTVLSDTAMKFLGGRGYSPVFIVWLRMCGVFVLGGFYFFPLLKHSLKTENIVRQLIRTVFMLGSGLVAALALRHNELGYYAVIAQLSPVVIAAGAVLFLKESKSAAVLLALILSLGGALLVAGMPAGQGGWNQAKMLPFGVVICFSAFSLMTRPLSRRVPAQLMLTNFFFFASVLSALLLPGHWRTPEWGDIPLILLMIVSNLGIQYTLIKAYSRTEASRLAPASYLQLVFAMAAGFLFWGERPGLRQLAGAAVIVTAGIFAIIKSQRKSQK